MQEVNGTHASSEHTGTYTIVFACEQSYWEHVFVSLYSIVHNNADLSFNVWILADAPDPIFFAHAEQLKRIHRNLEISWLPVEDDQFKGAPIGWASRATYYRLLLDRLLPDDVDRVLYIDADTVVRGSIKPLLEIELDENVVAATPQHPHRPSPLPPVDYAGRLGLPSGSKYFNAGVLLIDMERWRSSEVEQQCLEYVRANSSNPEKLEFWDQDVLNSVLVGDWKPLDPRFNFSEWTVEPELFIGQPETGSAGHVGPAIVHFAGQRKPWHGGTRHPYEADYWHYRMQTPYADRLLYLSSRAMRVACVSLRYVRDQARDISTRNPLRSKPETQ